MRILTAVLFFSLLFFCSLAQNNSKDSIVDAVPAWMVNDTAYYFKVKSFEQIIEGDTTSKTNNTFLIRAVFLGYDEEISNFEMEWTYFLVKDSLKNDSVIYYYENLYTLNYWIDSLGRFVEGDLIDVNLKMLYADQMMGRNMDVQLKIGNALSATGKVENIMFEDIIEFHRYFGYQYVLNDTLVVEFQDEDNPDLNRIKSIDTISLYYKDTVGYYSISSVERLTPEVAKDFSGSFMENTNYNIKDRAVFSKLMSNMQITSARDLLFHESGWLIEGMYAREILTDFMKIVTKNSFRIIFPEE